MILIFVAVGGFSNSDVLGSAKGWAGAFKYNSNAKKIILTSLIVMILDFRSL